jgi:lipopolysaccharide/colanic/teichoic acid biosynthesis glycosyltransferase
MTTRKKYALQETPRCIPACNYGHCRLVTEEWFARALSLERKRTERSRKPFVLALMNLEGVEGLNGNKDRYVHQVVSAVASFTRETDITGWYRNGSVLGTIFTELGASQHPSVSVASIASKIGSALETYVGQGKSVRIDVSYHVFPEDSTETKPSGTIDSTLYPDIDTRGRPGWLHSAGKRMVDVVLSGFALFFLLPLFLLVASAVKLSSKGPVLFRQERVGQFGKRFRFLKFRSMQSCSESALHEQYVRKLISGSLGVPENGIFKIQNDPRVTSVGRILRKTSLDELPQFWNVLIGEMSLVGPRPPLPYEVEAYDIWHRRRVLEAKPGITGLWQVTGRSRTCFDDMVRLDLHYTQSSSLWLDLKILLRTPRAVLAGDGAY